MKGIKPQRLSMLQRFVEHERRSTLVVTAIAYVALDAPRRLLTEQTLWQEAAEHVPGGLLDEGLPKPCGEVLASGMAHAAKPGGVQAMKLRLSLQRQEQTLLHKELAVWGDRYWKGDTPTEPGLFESMPLDWSASFGGSAWTRNPTGKGAESVESEHGPVQPLPNVEDPQALVASPNDRPEPVSFGAYGLGWPQRFERMGSRYDGSWLKERFPGPAEDFDAHFYCAGAPDQWIEGFFRAGDRITLCGMHPTASELTLELPPLVVRVFATQRAPGESELPGRSDPRWARRLQAFDARLDTVHLLPAIQKAALIYRATLPVAADDGDDIVHLMLAAESPEHPKPLEHYQRVLALRIDKERGALASMKDEDLMPPMEAGYSAKPDYGDIGEMVRLEHAGLANAERGRKKKLAEAQAKLEEAGFDVSEHFNEPDMPAIPDPYDVDAITETLDRMEKEAEEKQREMEAKKVEMEAEAKKSFEEAGFDYEAEMQKAADEAGGPPDFSAEKHMIMLHDMARIAAEGGLPMPDLERNLTDPRYEQTLIELEARVKESYLRFAHMMPPAGPVDEETRQMLRVRVQAAKDSGEPLCGQNLTRADLHDMDLSGMDLSGALLEGVDLSGANLTGAKLSGAVLARANLTDANLSDADLTDANLGDVRLKDTNLSGAILHKTALMKSEFDGAILMGASLRETDFLQVTFTNADFSHVEAHQPLFLQTDLRRVSFTGASMTQARFIECDVRGVDFTGANLDKAQLIGCQGDGACFAAARLADAVFVYECSFNDCSFDGAALPGATFNGTPLRRCDFGEAELGGAGFIAADLREANLYRIRARESLFVRANLQKVDARGADWLGAILQKAKVQGADMRGCNLSRADISLIQKDEHTQLDDALMLDTRVDPVYEERHDERLDAARRAAENSQ